MNLGQFIQFVVSVAIGASTVVLPTYFAHHKKLAAIAETVAKIVETSNADKMP